MSQSSSRSPRPSVLSSPTSAVCEEVPLSHEGGTGRKHRWRQGEEEAEGPLGMGEAQVTAPSEAELFPLPAGGRGTGELVAAPGDGTN